MSELEEKYNNKALIEVDQDLAEFKEIVKDIAENENVLALKEHVQHIASSRYAHCLEVSYYTFLVCKKLGLDGEDYEIKRNEERLNYCRKKYYKLNVL